MSAEGVRGTEPAPDRGAPPSSVRAAAQRPPGEATAILTRAVSDRLRALPTPSRTGGKRLALALYVLLLVLPTGVLGGLHWHQLTVDHRALVAAVPGDASDAARRLQDALVGRVHQLVAREDQRAFFEYRQSFFPPGTIGAELAFVPSPLVAGASPSEILAWFSYRGEEDEASAPLTLLYGARALLPGSAGLRDELHEAVRELRQRNARETFLVRLARVRSHRQERVAVPILAINLSDEQDVECLRDELPALRGMQNQSQEVTVSGFSLRFWRESDGTPRVCATRTVWIPADQQRRPMPSCFANFGRGVMLRQGFFIDPRWLFHDLPRALADQVLGSTQRFVGADGGPPNLETDVFTIHPLRVLGIETPRGEDTNYGMMSVVVDVNDLEARFRTQTLRYLGVVAMLVVSLGTGLVLLLRSVGRDLEAARRTENFVSAITHELRTPVAAIKLYGEMLDAGWVDSDDRRLEYYRRIVRETSRLETLVERVLEKGQIARRETKPMPGDLNNVIEGIAGSLSSLAPDGGHDLVFELDPDLPAVMLIPEGVRSIVTNLVENARKYAAVPPGGEPIRVVTRREGGAVLIEVFDRGPGIPPAERERIFDAFYRMGDERTRTARGTGLGLHLVALHAEAMGGRATVEDRPGGGTVFRVRLRAAAAHA